MDVERTAVDDVLVLTPRVHGDERGYLFEAWNAKRLSEAGVEVNFVQENQSGSARGVLRGLHYQNPCAQGKLIRVIRGEIFDVAVDLRRASPTFGRWAGSLLSAQNRRAMWLPPGMAHGFLVLGERAEVLYLCTAHHHPETEHAIRWDDPTLAIDWPLHGLAPRLSERDASALSFHDAPLFD